MNERLVRLAAALRNAVRSAGSRARANGFWIGSGAVGLAALVTAYAIGSSSLSAASAYDDETRRLAAIAAGADVWIDGLVPPLAAESALWSDSDRSVRTITSAGTDPTTIARLVAARAEEAGIGALGVRLLSADSVSPAPPREIGGWRIGPGPSAIAADFVGDWSAVIAFVGSLPPQVEVARIEVDPGPDRRLHARLLLASRAITGHAEPDGDWPEPAELDSLRRYLVPVDAAPDPDEYAAFLPARPAPAPTGARAPTAADGPRLSAILITGDQRVAIIDDRSVRPGDRLPGDARVLSIGRDHVVIRERNGSLRTLRLSTGTGQLQ